MKTRYILLLAIVLITNIGYSQCKTGPILTVEKNLNNLTEKILNDFFDQFSEDCKKNVEFSQFSNKILFATTEANPRLVIEVLDKRKEKDGYKFILYKYTIPIHDMIDLNGILKKVKEVKNESSTKKKIIENIQIAISKY